MKDLFEIVLNDLLEIKKKLNKTVFIGLIFSIFGYLYVIEPYFLYKKQEIILAKQIAQKEAEIKKLTNKLQNLELERKRIDISLEQIKTKIKRFPNELRQSLREIEKSINSQNQDISIQQSFPISKIQIPPNIKTFEGAVQWYISNWFNKLILELENNVIEPALKISTENEKDKEELKNLSQEAIKKVNNYIKSIDPNFWKSYAFGKVPVARGLEKTVLNSIKPIEIKIKEITKNLSSKIKKQKMIIKNLEEKNKEINKQKEILKQRLNSIESPIGKLPINLTDFIKTFPLLLVVFVGMLHMYFTKAVKLSNYLKEVGEKAKIQQEKVRYFTDLWFFKNYSISGIFTLILLIYLRSVYLVLSDKSLFFLLTEKVNFIEQIFFTTFYIVGGITILSLLVISAKLYKKL